ncbi:hypothetical protein ABZ369_33275, partial [Streptomyces sp. NPDC005918]
GAPARVTVDAPPGAGPVLSDLTRMENALAALTGESSPLSHGETDEITTRLEALLTRWRATNTTADEDDGAADRLKGASADQIFDFIDNELGVGHDTSRATPTPKAG